MSRSSMSMSACLRAGLIAILCTLPACHSSDDDDGGGSTMTITSFIPNSGAVGDTVTITGTGFEASIPDMEVDFFDDVAATLSSASTTQLVVTVPAGAVTGPITVTNGISGDIVTTTTDFTVTTSAFGPSVGTGVHGIAVGPSGSVWTWGENADGQLGDGTTTSDPTPGQVAGITTAVQVEAGQNFSIARLSDGTLRAWGANFDGQLGDGTATGSSTPVTVSAASGLTGVDMLDVSFARGAISRASDGKVYLWGDNSFGQIGNGTTTDALIPTERPIAAGSIDLAIGDHTLVVKPDSTVGAWGRNHQGQLGDGTTTNSLLPLSVLSAPGVFLNDVAKVALGNGFSIALMTDGTVQAWGDNALGACGDGTTTDRPFPVVVTGLTTIVDVDACFDSAIARKSDGTVWTWGGGSIGQIGNGTNPAAQTTAIQVPGLTNIVDIDGGDAGFLVVESDGDRWAWGSNLNGQLGDGTTTDSNVPVLVIDF